MLVWFKFCWVQVCPKNRVSYGTICQKLYFQNYGLNKINVSFMIKLDRGQKLCMQQNLKLHLGVPLKRSSLIIPYKTFTLTGLLFFLNLPNPMLPQFQRLQIIQTEALYCFWSFEGLPPVIVLFFAAPHPLEILVVFFRFHTVFLDLCTKMVAFVIVSLLFYLLVLGIWCLALRGCQPSWDVRGAHLIPLGSWFLLFYGSLCITLLYLLIKKLLSPFKKKTSLL